MTEQTISLGTEGANAVILEESCLDQASGGIGLLLPAVQKIREAAARAADGSVKPVSVTDGTSNT